MDSIENISSQDLISECKKDLSERQNERLTTHLQIIESHRSQGDIALLLWETSYFLKQEKYHKSIRSYSAALNIACMDKWIEMGLDTSYLKLYWDKEIDKYRATPCLSHCNRLDLFVDQRPQSKTFFDLIYYNVLDF